MNPIRLIKLSLGADGLRRVLMRCAEPVSLLDEDLFTSYRIYAVYGEYNQFDFLTPQGSCAYYAVNGWEALRLSRAGKEIQRVLAKEWRTLTRANPVRLASLLLRFYGAGSMGEHRVLIDGDELRSMGEPKGRCRFNEKALARAFPKLGTTSFRIEGNVVMLRAIILCGYMERHLGIEVFSIRDDGTVLMKKRCVLSQEVFSYVPGPTIIE